VKPFLLALTFVGLAFSTLVSGQGGDPLGGQLAWRQHDGGHTDAPNWKYFIPWADKFLDHKPSSQPTSASDQAVRGADRPSPQTDTNSQIAHAELLNKAKTGRIDVYFVGDSITRR
jgi:hypothetical protein